MNRPNRIEVLLVDGNSDHYIVPVDMLQERVEVDGETYERTAEVRKVDEKNRHTSTYRVYRPSASTPQLLDAGIP